MSRRDKPALALLVMTAEEIGKRIATLCEEINFTA
jgi:hypothetical protein